MVRFWNVWFFFYSKFWNFYLLRVLEKEKKLEFHAVKRWKKSGIPASSIGRGQFLSGISHLWNKNGLRQSRRKKSTQYCTIYSHFLKLSVTSLTNINYTVQSVLSILIYKLRTWNMRRCFHYTSQVPVSSTSMKYVTSAVIFSSISWDCKLHW